MTSLVLFKNLAPEHFKDFKANGKVLLSSLKRLREKEGTGRDELEGIKSIQLHPTKPKAYKTNEIANLFPANISIEGGYFHSAAGSKVNIGTQLPEAYILCTSIHRIKDYGDAFYQILDVHRFGKVLLDSLRVHDPKVFRGTFGRVAYGGMKDPIEDLDNTFKQNYSGKNVNFEDYYCKPSSFSSEGEYRYVFFTLTDHIEDKKIIECMELVTLCSF